MTALVVAAGALLAGCSGGDGSPSADVVELLDGEVDFAEVSEEVARFYGDLYYDGDLMHDGSIDGAKVRVVEREEGYSTAEVEEMEESGRFDDLPGDHAAWAHDGVLIVVSADDTVEDAVVERLQRALAG